MGPLPLLTLLLLKKKPQSRRKTQTIFKSPLTRYVQEKVPINVWIVQNMISRPV